MVRSIMAAQPRTIFDGMYSFYFRYLKHFNTLNEYRKVSEISQRATSASYNQRRRQREKTGRSKAKAGPLKKENHKCSIWGLGFRIYILAVYDASVQVWKDAVLFVD
jgi:hypothetical protein